MYVGMYVGMWQDGLDLTREDIRWQLIASHQRQQYGPYDMKTRTPTSTLIWGNPALRTRTPVSLALVTFRLLGPNFKIKHLTSCKDVKFFCEQNVTVNAFLAKF